MVCGCTNAIGDVGRLLGTKWKEMSDEEKKVRRLSHKQPYNDLANRDKARAEAEKAAYAVRVPAYTEQGISVGACCVFVFSTAVPGCPYRACAMDRSPSTSSVHGLYFSLILSHLACGLFAKRTIEQVHRLFILREGRGRTTVNTMPPLSIRRARRGVAPRQNARMPSLRRILAMQSKVPL